MCCLFHPQDSYKTVCCMCAISVKLCLNVSIEILTSLQIIQSGFFTQYGWLDLLPDCSVKSIQWFTFTEGQSDNHLLPLTISTGPCWIQNYIQIYWFHSIELCVCNYTGKLSYQVYCKLIVTLLYTKFKVVWDIVNYYNVD